MQYGDLAESNRETLILVLEGVLASVVTLVNKTGIVRRHTTTTNHIHWYEVPLKRLIATKERYPQYEISVATFLGDDVADEAAEYFNLFDIPHDEIKAWNYDVFCSALPFMRRLRAVYDSDVERLQNYGQYGVAVVAGSDW